MEKAKVVVAPDQIWVNPYCGLKTRHWGETKKPWQNGGCGERGCGYWFIKTTVL